MGDGAREVVKLCKMVNLGCNAAISKDPFEKLDELAKRQKSRTI